MKFQISKLKKSLFIMSENKTIVDQILNLLEEKNLKIKKLEDELAIFKKKDNFVVKIDTKIFNFLLRCIGDIDEMDEENYKKVIINMKDNKEDEGGEYTALDLASWCLSNAPVIYCDGLSLKWYMDLIFQFEKSKQYKRLIKAIDKAIKRL